MGGGIQGGDDELITSINVTPLVDIVLVLLIILMVTASYIVSRSIPMDLPAAETGETTPRTLTVSITADGQLYHDGEEVTRATLRDRIRNYRQANEEPRAVIAADGQVPHAQVVQVIDLLRQERVTRFAINVDPRALQEVEE